MSSDRRNTTGGTTRDGQRSRAFARVATSSYLIFADLTAMAPPPAGKTVYQDLVRATP